MFLLHSSIILEVKNIGKISRNFGEFRVSTMERKSGQKFRAYEISIDFLEISARHDRNQPRGVFRIISETFEEKFREMERKK